MYKHHNFFIEIPSCGKKFIFVTEFVILDKNPPFYEVNKWVQKWVPACSNFKNIYPIPLFTIVFRPKIVYLDTDSILRVKMISKSVK